MMTTPPTAGTFQSLAQLAVALNAAFASLATFFGNDYQREERRVRAALARIGRRDGPSSQQRPERDKSLTDLRLLSGRITQLGRRHDFFIEQMMRPVSVIAVAISFIALLYTSYCSTDEISPWVSRLIACCSAPFILGILGTASMSMHLWFTVSRARVKIENRYRAQGGV